MGEPRAENSILQTAQYAGVAELLANELARLRQNEKQLVQAVLQLFEERDALQRALVILTRRQIV